MAGIASRASVAASSIAAIARRLVIGMSCRPYPAPAQWRRTLARFPPAGNRRRAAIGYGAGHAHAAAGRLVRTRDPRPRGAAGAFPGPLLAAARRGRRPAPGGLRAGLR